MIRRIILIMTIFSMFFSSLYGYSALQITNEFELEKDSLEDDKSATSVVVFLKRSDGEVCASSVSVTSDFVSSLAEDFGITHAIEFNPEPYSSCNSHEMAMIQSAIDTLHQNPIQLASLGDDVFTVVGGSVGLFLFGYLVLELVTH